MTQIETDIQTIIDSRCHLDGPLLPILHALQASFGQIPETALPLIANRLNLTQAEVHGVISFYHDFRTSPAGRQVIKICRAEACQSVGADVLIKDMLSQFNMQAFGTTPNNTVTIEPVYCLGLCACGPAAMIDGQVIGRATPARLNDAIKDQSKAAQ